MNTISLPRFVPVFGDWHGDVEWAKACVRWLSEEGYTRALHVGDFAIGFNNNRQYTKPLNYLCQQLGIKLYITPGNHENYDVINALPLLTEGEDAGWQQLASNLLVAPRGLRWSWRDVSFVSLGGGNSIDHRLRTQGRDWWREEQITMGDIMNIEAGGKADVMITHVAPNAAEYDLDGSYWRPEDVRYSDESRTVMDLALAAVQPKLFFHGHYHVYKEQDATVQAEDGNKFTTHFVSLGMNKQEYNAVVLDLIGLSLTAIKHPIVLNPVSPEQRPRGWAAYEQD